MVDEAQCSVTIAQFANHRQVGGLIKRSAQAGSDQGVVVDQHHTHQPTPFRRRVLRPATATTSRALPTHG